MALGGVLALAQTATSIAPLRTAPVEKFTVNPGHRDWAPTVLAGTTIIGGNSSNRGGLFAVDTIAGKLKWTFRPTGTASGNPFVATAPAVSGGLAIVPMGNTLVAVTIATGREAWRGPATALSAAVAADGGMAFVLGEDASFHALDAATGREKWAAAVSSQGIVQIRSGGERRQRLRLAQRRREGWRRQSSRGVLPAPGGARRQHRAGTLAVSRLAGRHCRHVRRQAIVAGDTYFARQRTDALRHQSHDWPRPLAAGRSACAD